MSRATGGGCLIDGGVAVTVTEGRLDGACAQVGGRHDGGRLNNDNENDKGGGWAVGGGTGKFLPSATCHGPL